MRWPAVAPQRWGRILSALGVATFVLLAYGLLAHEAAAAPATCKATNGAFAVTVNGDGTQQGTLRWAITCANSATLPATISFDRSQLIRSASGVYELRPTTLLPTLTRPFTLDGGTLDTTNRPVVRIDGSSSPGAAYGIVTNIASFTGSTFRNVWMSGWSAAGADALKLQGTGPVAVTGSLFGTDIVGAAGNYTGIEIGNSSPIGLAGSQRNVFAGNVRGIQVNGGGCGTSAGGCAITGNYVGTNLAGTGAAGNSESGIRVENAYALISGNLVSGNRDGIRFVGGGSGGSVAANRIGLTASGGPLGNTAAGVSTEGANGIRVGAPLDSTAADVAANQNTIAYNARGVTVISGSGDVIRGNRIFGNTTLGIDLGNDGPTANDPGDGDRGANGTQNYPDLASASLTATTLTVQLTLDSAPGLYTVDFYAGGDDDCGASSRGLRTSSTWLGSVPIAASSVQMTVTLPGVVQGRGTLVATATSAGGDTSELSGCKQFVDRTPRTSNVTIPAAGTLLEDAVTPASVTFTATDLDGPYGAGFAFVVDQAPSKGVLGFTAPVTCVGTTCTQTATYLPQPDLNGADSFTFHATDGTNVSPTATGTVWITSVNDAPTFVKGADQAVAEDTGGHTVAGWATAVDAGAANESGQSLTFLVSTTASSLFTAGGQPAITPQGALSYTLRPDAFGTANVTVRLHDDGGTSNGGNDTSPAQTFTIAVANVYDPPAGSVAPVVTPEDTAVPITLTATDVDGLPVTLSIGSSPSHGTLGPLGPTTCALGTCTAAVTYTPAQDYNGPDGFSYAMNDQTGHPVPQTTVSISVTPVNDAPVAAAASLETIAGSAEIVTLSATDVDGPYDLLSFSIVSPPAHGTVTPVAGTRSCSGTTCTADWRYTPDAGYHGADTFTYAANDGTLTSAAATVTVTVAPPVVAVVTLTPRTTTPCEPVVLAGPLCVQAGARQVPFASVAPSKVVATGSGVSATPVNDIPVNDVPVNDIPVNDIALGTIPINEIGLLDVTEATDPAAWAQLEQTLISTLPVSVSGGWPAILAGTPLADRVLQNVSLADVLDDAQARQQFERIPLSAFDFSHTPLGSLTAFEIVMGSFHLSEIPLGPSDVAANGTVDTAATLQSWCDLLRSVYYACGGGDELAGRTVLSTALRGTPLNDIPVNDIPVNDIPVNDIPLAGVPVNEIPINEIGLGGTPVNEILLGATPVNDIPVNEIPVNEIPVNEIPVNEIPVNDIDLAKTSLGTIPVNEIALQQSPVNEVPVNEIATPGAVFICGTSCTGTIGSNAGNLRPGVTWALLLGALKPTTVVPYWQLLASLNLTYGELFASVSPDVLAQFTLAQLLGADAAGANQDGIGSLSLLQLLRSLDLSKVTLGDILAAFLQPQSFDWESLDLAVLKPQSLAGVVGGTLTYDTHVALTNGIAGRMVGTQVVATLPVEKDFVFLKGTARLVAADDPTHPIVLDDPAPGALLTWSVSLKVGRDYVLSFDVRPGVTLGERNTTVDVKPLNSDTTHATAPVVVVGDTFEVNDSFPTGADRARVGLDTSSFFLSYIRKPGDVDFFTFSLVDCATVPAGEPCDPEGSRVTFRLGHLPKDYDLAVYGPTDTLAESDGSTPPLDAQPLGDEVANLTHDAESLPTQTLDDVFTVTPPEGQALLGISSNRGTDADAVTVVSQGHGESYTVQVSGFNGSASDNPYMLRATKKAPPPMTCTPRFAGATAAAAATESILPAGAEPTTLFVVNTRQLRLAYGDDAQAAIAAVDGAPASFPAGFPTAVLHVDAAQAVQAAQSVQAAYASWNECPSSAARANDVVTAVNARIAAFRHDHPSVKNVVLVGGDGVVPFARLYDFTTVANEAGYDNATVGSSYLGWGERAGMLLSDDPYASTSPVRFFTRELYLPNLAVGRLVETPAQIARQITAFHDAGGVMNPTTSLTTGYDFLQDGARSVDGALTASSALARATLINNTWDRSALLTAWKPGTTPPSITSLNAHADYWAFQPALTTADASIVDVTDPRHRGLVTPADVLTGTPLTFAQRLILSMGCHAGLSVEDAFLAGAHAKDWAEAFSAQGALAFVGNTGFGYGDTDLVAYSEDLNRRFAANAVAGRSLGQALALAKQSYAGGLGVFGVYDEKAMAELTLYGLPMWRLDGATAPAAAPAAAVATPTVLDPLVGLRAQPIDVTPRTQRHDVAGRGSYWSDNADPEGIGFQVTHFRPVEPREVLPVSIPNAHGALITSLTSHVADGDVDPVFARPVVDSAATEPELAWDGAVFPAKLQALTSTRNENGNVKRQLVLLTGQFTGLPSEGAAPSARGQQVVFDSMSALVYGAPAGNDHVAQPTFQTVDAKRILRNGNPDSVAFTVDVVGPNTRTVKRIVAAYDYGTDVDGNTTWKFVDLVLSGGVWRGSGRLEHANFHYFIQAVTEDGTVGVTTNKGRYYDAAATIDVSAVTTAEAPSIVIASPSVASGGSVFLKDDNANAWYACLDPDSIVTCSATVTAPDGTIVAVTSGGLLPTGSAGSYEFTVTATVDGVAAAAKSVTYAVAGIAVSGTKGDGQWYTSDVIVSIDAPPGTVGLTLTVDGSAAAPITTDGSHTAVLTLSSGGSATTTIARDATRPAITFEPPSGGTFAVGAVVTVSVTCADATSGIAACSPAPPVVLSTAVPGSFSFAASAKDSAGNVQTATYVYTVSAPAPSLSGKVVFSRAGALYVVDPFATSGAPALLYSSSSEISQPAVSPDGSRLAFVQGGDLYLRTATGTVTQLTSTAGVGEDAPSWSPDGLRLAFNSSGTYGGVTSKGQDVWTATVTSGSVGASLTGYANLTATNNDDVWPSWSPSGTEVVFASNRSKGSFKLYKVDTETLVQTRVTIGSNDDVQAAWSPATLPGGERIAFSSNFAGGTGGFEIHLVMPVADSSKTRVTTNTGTDGQPLWITSATGQIQILFVSELGFSGQGAGLYRMSPAGSGITKLAGTAASDANPG